MIPTVASLADEVVRRAQGLDRILVGIAGPPGAGKTTLADALRDELAVRGERAAVLPMDGFHMDNALLDQRGLLKVKGAPETFDVRGLSDVVRALAVANEDVLVPIFDRSREIAIAAARNIALDTRIILVEGNYLLLNETPWNVLDGVFHLTIFVGPAYQVLESRLRHRWIQYGYDEAAIAVKLYENDLPNGKRIIENSRKADFVIEEFEIGK